MPLPFTWTAGVLVFVAAPAAAVAARAFLGSHFCRHAPDRAEPDAESDGALPPNVVDPRWLL